MSILLACSFDADEWAAWLPCLHAALPGETWQRADAAEPLSAAERAAVDIAIVANPRPGQLVGYPRLRLVQSLWAGVDRLLADASLPAQVPLARMIDPAMSTAMAETALWAVLGLHRHYFCYARQQAQQHWRQLDQRRADEVQVLVAGAGELGLSVARRLLDQGYRVQAWARTPRPTAHQAAIDAAPDATAPSSGQDGGTTDTAARLASAGPGCRVHHGADAWAELAAQADIVINLLPLTPATRGYFDAGRFAGFKPGAGFINLARGAAVVDDALLAALDSGQIGHAVLDVFNHEPLPPDHAYWRHAQVTVLPHAAALTDPRSAALIAAANVRTVRAWTPATAPQNPADAVSAELIGRVDRQRGY
jgi:glyoxylate/hydroxypyruvate reductase A